jgi:ATP-binding cassette subfamily F protein uup
VTDWLEDRLLESRVPLLLVTHDRYFLDRVVDRIVELEHGRLTEYDGGYAQYLWKRAERDHAAGNAAHERRMLLRRETAWARRGPPARTTKSKSRMARWAALVADGGDAAIGTVSFTLPPGPRLGTKVLELHGATKSFDGRVVVPPLDFELRAGMRLGIVGPNGAGKSTFLSLCTGALAPDGGTRAVGDTVKFAAIDQQRRGLDPKNTVVDEVASADMEHVRVGGQSMRIESFLDRFLFPGPTKFSRIEDLSGGERNRVLLAKLLIQAGNVRQSREADQRPRPMRTLEEALVAEGAALIVITTVVFDRIARTTVLRTAKGARHRRRPLVAAEKMAYEQRRRQARTAGVQAAKRKAAGRTAAPAAPAPAPRWRSASSPSRRRRSSKCSRRSPLEKRAAELDRNSSTDALPGLQQSREVAGRARRSEARAEIALNGGSSGGRARR